MASKLKLTEKNKKILSNFNFKKSYRNNKVNKETILSLYDINELELSLLSSKYNKLTNSLKTNHIEFVKLAEKGDKDFKNKFTTKAKYKFKSKFDKILKTLKEEDNFSKKYFGDCQLEYELCIKIANYRGVYYFFRGGFLDDIYDSLMIGGAAGSLTNRMGGRGLRGGRMGLAGFGIYFLISRAVRGFDAYNSFAEKCKRRLNKCLSNRPVY